MKRWGLDTHPEVGVFLHRQEVLRALPEARPPRREEGALALPGRCRRARGGRGLAAPGLGGLRAAVRVAAMRECEE